tara:strand:+ start:19646 stop:20377 length:732 start_codon:yes stop_codon:yes gene_type:complete
MIKNALTTFKPSVQMITKDKVNFLLASFPMMVGAALYYFAGRWAYSEFTTEGKRLIESHISEGVMGSIVYWIISIILTIVLYFLINYTFVLIVSLISSPFNDLLSARIEKKLKGENNFTMSESLSFISGKLISVLLNESKKIVVIVVLSGLAFLLSFFPILAPVSIFLNTLILAAGFVDYTWSRKNLTSSACFKDLRGNFLGYSLSGGFFLALVAIPFVAIIVPPLATSYYTIYWIKNHEYSA